MNAHPFMPESVRRCLDGAGLEYEVLAHPEARTPLEAARLAYVPPERLVTAVLLADRRGPLMAIHPASHRLERERLNRQLERDLAPVTVDTARELIRDCAPGIIPPLPQAYGIKGIVDEALAKLDEVYFQAGSPRLLVRMEGRAFRFLHRGTWRGQGIARPDPGLAVHPDALCPSDREARIARVDELPPLPDTARRILQLRADPYAHARDLARIVEQDPSLAAQVVRYANAPLFGYGRTVTTLHDAITRVLGYDLVMNIALGLSAGRALRNPVTGPLGLDAFWRHAVHAAALTQGLGNVLALERRPRPGLAYLAGLLHNFGVLVMGHLFPAEFFWLNKAVAARPHVPVPDIEQEILGTTHAHLGARLMQVWHMPAEVTVAVRHHHDPDYDGLHAVYAQLTRLADCLLAREGLGDLPEDTSPAPVLDRLRLSEEQARAVMDTVLESASHLNSLARQLAA